MRSSDCPLLEELLTDCSSFYFALVSRFGCLARIGITALFTGSQQSAFPVLWSQALGGFVFGLITHRREDIIRHSPELYVALRVGESLLLATTSLGSSSANSPLCAVLGCCRVFWVYSNLRNLDESKLPGGQWLQGS